MKIVLKEGTTTTLGSAEYGSCFIFVNVPDDLKKSITAGTVYMKAELPTDLGRGCLCVRLVNGASRIAQGDVPIKEVKQTTSASFDY